MEKRNLSVHASPLTGRLQQVLSLQRDLAYVGPHSLLGIFSLFMILSLSLFFFWPCCMDFGILVPWPVIKPGPSSSESVES